MILPMVPVNPETIHCEPVIPVGMFAAPPNTWTAALTFIAVPENVRFGFAVTVAASAPDVITWLATLYPFTETTP